MTWSDFWVILVATVSTAVVLGMAPRSVLPKRWFVWAWAGLLFVVLVVLRTVGVLQL